MMPDRLQQMFDMQRELQAVMPPIREFPSPDMAERMDQVRTSALGLLVELVEGLNETGWKPWASTCFINTETYKGEMVDIWHFFMNLCMLGNVTPDDLYHGYMRKHDVNRKRQADGYDGVSTKCLGCGRAYDDEAVKCYPRAKTSVPPRTSWCMTLGFIDDEGNQVLSLWNAPTDPAGLPVVWKK